MTSLYPPYKPPTPAPRVTEFEILKAHHKFLRQETQQEQNDDASPGINEHAAASATSWGDRLASKYEATLYREFAVCDLKHYKSGNFSLRWRTEDEVLSGAGESSCGNTRCEFHPPPNEEDDDEIRRQQRQPSLTTLELPFSYIEHGQEQSALVKVVLCKRCVKKLMWKRNKDKAESMVRSEGEGAPSTLEGDGVRGSADASGRRPKTIPRQHRQDSDSIKQESSRNRHHPYERSS